MGQSCLLTIILLLYLLYGNEIDISGPTIASCGWFDSLGSCFGNSSSSNKQEEGKLVTSKPGTTASTTGQQGNPNPSGGGTTTYSNGVEIDIDKDKQSTNDYDFNNESHKIIKTYKAKSNSYFKTVKYNGTVVWTASTENSEKALFVASKYKIKLYIAILLEGEKLKFYKLDGTWKDETEGKYSPDKLQMYHKGENEDSKSGDKKELTKDKYEPDLYSLQFGYGYTFKDGAQCTEIKYDGVTIWTHTDKYPTGIYIGLLNNIGYVKIQGKTDTVIELSKFKGSTDQSGPTPANKGTDGSGAATPRATGQTTQSTPSGEKAK